MSITPKKRFEILKRDDFRCRYCGITADESELEVDHIDPRANGGTDDEENLVTSCKPCNRGKGITPVEIKANGNGVRQNNGFDALTKKFFHSFVSCKRCGEPQVRWQGYVVGPLPDNHYLVQTFSWMSGDPYTQIIVPFSEMLSWQFYGSSAEMNYIWENEESQRHGIDRCEKLEEQRYPPDAGFPDWLVGKTIKEGEEIIKSLNAHVKQ